MKKIAVLMLLATTPLVFGQDELVRRVFQLKYAEPNRVRTLLFGWNDLRFDDQMKTIAVQAFKSKMDEYEQIIKRFDVPPAPIPNVEITIYLMSALAQPSTAAVPPELEGVVKQLKSTFSYKGYELIDTQIIRAREGKGGQASGVIDRGASVARVSGFQTANTVRFNEVRISTDEKGRAIHIRELSVGLRIPISSTGAGADAKVNYLNTGINTDVDVHEGQKVVVGKANMDGSDRASIVVLTAKVVD